MAGDRPAAACRLWLGTRLWRRPGRRRAGPWPGGSGVGRPGAAETLRAQIAGLLGERDPWTWLAERDVDPVGLLIAEPPEVAGWIAPRTCESPVAYLLALFVVPAERGTGVGAALTGQ